jgi:L-ribulose-5-phosphate 3-epimerase
VRTTGSPTRREFLAGVGAAAGGAWAFNTVRAEAAPRGGFRGQFCLFSKHLPMLAWAPLAEAVKRVGFGGVDLTVRPGGHVEPARASEDLPRAIEAIRQRGVDVPMITTALLSSEEPTARSILEAAGKSGVRFFKPGYYRYALSDVRAEVAAAGRALAGLAALGRTFGIELGYHNHEGNVGASVWDIAPEIDRLPARWAGYYFDVRHAVVEGGRVGWKAATRLVAPRLKMIAVKDVFWEKGARGWGLHDCPLGEGMVDWTWYSKALAEGAFHGPVSVHLEYDIEGSTADEKRARTLEAAARDLRFIRDRITQAYRESSF